MNTRNDIEYWLALSNTPFIGYKSFAEIVAQFPKLGDFFNLGTSAYNQLGLHPETIKSLQNPSWEAIEHDLQWAASNKDHYIMTLADDHYPHLLRQLAYPPPVLFIKGEIALLNTPQLAIVGARSPSATGKETAFCLARTLAQAGLTITSGLALGVDSAAHQGALREGKKTIAVIGTGINICYPSSNKKLAAEISQQGAIISEFSFNTRPIASNFPRRNQIISGLSLGTLVVEANLKSGSLITAKFALEQGREVFAIPGSIYNPMARGCHLLLKEGAKLVETAQDVLEELPLHPKFCSLTPLTIETLHEKTLEENHSKLLECIGYEPTKIDLLVERTQFSISVVASMLADLELAGYIFTTTGGYMRVAT